MGKCLPLEDSPFPIKNLKANLRYLNLFTAMGSGILFAYPQLATIAGVQGLIIYAFASAAPLLIFAVLGPIIRKKAPEGFVLTEWTRQRYGLVAMLFLSLMTMVTMYDTPLPLLDFDFSVIFLSVYLFSAGSP